MKKFFVFLALLVTVVTGQHLVGMRLSRLSRSILPTSVRGTTAFQNRSKNYPWIGRSFPQGAGAMKFGSYPRFAPGMRTFASLSREQAFQILNIGKEATPAQIKRAYYKKVKQYHPDKLHGKSEQAQREATEKFREIKAAYDLLKAPAGSSAEQQKVPGAPGVENITYGKGVAGVEKFIRENMWTQQASEGSNDVDEASWKKFKFEADQWTEFKLPQGLQMPIKGWISNRKFMVNDIPIHCTRYIIDSRNKGDRTFTRVTKYSFAAPGIVWPSHDFYVGEEVTALGGGIYRVDHLQEDEVKAKFEDAQKHHQGAEEYDRFIKELRTKKREEEQRKEQQRREWEAASPLGKLRITFGMWSAKPHIRERIEMAIDPAVIGLSVALALALAAIEKLKGSPRHAQPAEPNVPQKGEGPVLTKTEPTVVQEPQEGLRAPGQEVRSETAQQSEQTTHSQSPTPSLPMPTPLEESTEDAATPEERGEEQQRREQKAREDANAIKARDDALKAAVMGMARIVNTWSTLLSSYLRCEPSLDE